MTSPDATPVTGGWKDLLARPGARAAAGNFAWLAGDKVVRFGLNHVVAFWVARHLGPDQLGVLAFAVAAVGLVQPLAELGLEAVLRREFIRSPANAATLAATARGLRGIAAAVATVLFLLSLTIGWAAPDERPLVLVLAVSFWSPALLVGESWLQARLAARGIVTAQWIVLAAGAAARVVLILNDGRLFGFATITALEGIATGWLIAWPAHRSGLRYGRFDRTAAKALLREAWPLLLSGVAVVLYLRVDAVMLRALRTEADVGIYAAATRFAEIWYFIPMGLAASLLPALLRTGTGDHKRWQAFFDLNAALAYGIALATWLLSDSLIRLAYGSAFAPAAGVLGLYVWSLPLAFLGVARTQALISAGHTGFYLCATSAGLALNVALNLALIPRYGPWGAALATIAAQLLAAWLSSFLFLPLRGVAWMQTRALLIPIRWFHYVRGIS